MSVNAKSHVRGDGWYAGFVQPNVWITFSAVFPRTSEREPQNTAHASRAGTTNRHSSAQRPTRCKSTAFSSSRSECARREQTPAEDREVQRVQSGTDRERPKDLRSRILIRRNRTTESGTDCLVHRPGKHEEQQDQELATRAWDTHITLLA